MTLAVARLPFSPRGRPPASEGTLSLVGIGPGDERHLTPAATQAIAEAEVVVGFGTYIKLVRHLLAGKEVVQAGMTEEISRARAAIQRAQAGARVAVISSGDAGVYGMTSLVFQVLQELGWKRGDPPQLRLVPGITAAISCAAWSGPRWGTTSAAFRSPTCSHRGP